MSTNQEEKFNVYMGSTEIEVTKVMIEEDGWNATELLYEDLRFSIHFTPSRIAYNSVEISIGNSILIQKLIPYP